MKVVLIGVNATYNHTNPAIRSLVRYCRLNGCSEEFVDFVCHEFTINESIRDNIAVLRKENAEIYGFSCYIWNIETILEMAEILKKLLPDSIILLGGPEVSFENTEYLMTHPFIDYVIAGPGEYAFLKWIQSRMDFDTENQTIPDTLSKHRIQGESLPLSEMPFPYNDEDKLDNLKMIYYESTRGCPFCCTYCLSSSDSGVDALSYERVRSDLLFFIRQDVKQVKLVDRTFNFDDHRARKIWSFLIEEYENRPFRTNFHFEIAADLLSTESLNLLTLAPPGLFQFEIGVQTTNPLVLDHIRRKSNLDKLFENVTILRKTTNIPLHLDLIAGLPGENYQSFSNSFHDVITLRPHMLQLGFLKMLKGSPVRSQAQLYHLIYSNLPPYEIVETGSMTFEQLLQLKKIEIVLERYYNSGLFKYSMEFLFGFQPNMFELFDQLACQWEERKLFARNPSRQDIIQALYTVGCKWVEPDRSLIYRDLLKFDYYCHDKKGNVMELNFNFSLHHPGLARGDEKEKWYKPTGEPVCLRPRLEHYSFDATELLKTGKATGSESFVLYEMFGDKPYIHDIMTIEK